MVQILPHMLAIKDSPPHEVPPFPLCPPPFESFLDGLHRHCVGPLYSLRGGVQISFDQPSSSTLRGGPKPLLSHKLMSTGVVKLLWLTACRDSAFPPPLQVIRDANLSRTYEAERQNVWKLN